MTFKNIRKTIALALVGINAFLPLSGKAEEANKIELGFDSRVYVEQAGTTMQDIITLKEKDKETKAFAEFSPEENRSYGFELKNTNAKINLGFKDELKDSSRASLTLYGPNHSFIGGSAESLPDSKDVIAYAGTDIPGKAHLELTGDIHQNFRLALMKDFDKFGLGIGAGRNSDKTFEGNLSLHNSKVWAFAKFGERPLDARLLIGDIKPGRNYALSVTDSGFNELDNMGDQTLKFDIGKNQDLMLEYYGVNSILGDKPGDKAVYIRFKEDQRIYGDLAFRLPNIGLARNPSFIIGGFRDEITRDSGVRSGVNFSVGKNLEFQINGARSEGKDMTIGFYTHAKF